ncbi:dipeptide ABC transporter ATP-binding protein [Corynebacterium pacaense]|uniref:dipeptide ABC transporter ATP-binding protein n=1 Tax=Corynebacterium pacaense TaxID=1816684 RepID=UPI001FE5BEE9|nr:ABC transporter ATP-binding protein [Corynebacterium pacaense]
MISTKTPGRDHATDKVETPPRVTPAGGGDALVAVRDLSIAIGGRPIVSDISFSIEPGTCTALVGESGAGKSMTAHALLGLIPDSATITAGALDFDGRDLRNLSTRQWRKLRGGDIGLVLQDALVSLDPLVPVGKQITETLRLHTGLSRRERKDRARELLGRVGVPDPAQTFDRYPHQLSGGLRQRALIATALAGEPRLIIADEPTTALDVTVQAQVLDLLAQLKEAGTGLLLVSHDLAVVAALADHIVVMRSGEVMEQGNPEEVLHHPSSDYTRQLLEAVPSASSRGERLSPAPVAHFSGVTAGGPGESGGISVETSGLRRVFPLPGGQSLTAVDDVSFTIASGTTLGIVGESGSGKSTVARIVLGLERPDDGEVHIGGQPWTALSEAQRRPRRHLMQVISQDPLSSFDPRYSVEALLTEALRASGVEGGGIRDRGVKLLEQVGLNAGHLSRHPLQLSGGQRQRVAIARALATSPRIIVCDEPVSALDVSVQAQVLDLLSDLQEQTNVTMLFISHDLGVIQHIADEVAVMRRGRVVESGPVDEVFTDPRDAYTRELIAAIPRLT